MNVSLFKALLKSVPSVKSVVSIFLFKIINRVIRLVA